jgi:diguanylate cyclase (GGDEF)-like protein
MPEIAMKRRVEAMLKRAYRLRGQDLDLAIRIATEALELAEHVDDATEARAMRILSACVYGKDRAQALELAIQAYPVAVDSGDHECAAGCLLCQFVFYNNAGSLERAFQLVREAYSHAVQSGDRALIGLCLYNMSVNSHCRLDYQAAVDYALQAREVTKGIRNYIHRWRILAGYCGALVELGQMDNAVPLLRKAIDGAMKVGEYYSARDCAASLCVAYNRMKRPDLARETAEEALRMCAEHRIEEHIVQLHTELARAMIEQGQTQLAIDTLQFSLISARDRDSVDSERTALKALADAYAAQDEMANAFDSLQDYVKITETCIRRESEALIRDLEVSHLVDVVRAEATAAKQKTDELEKLNRQLKETLKQKVQLQDELERLASTDELTGVMNRRCFMVEANAMLDHSQMEGEAMSLLMMDVDHFKTFNDDFGHAAGDVVLRKVADACAACLRPTDLLARMGGEEFAVALPGRDSVDAGLVAERLRKAVSSIDLGGLAPDRIVTVSIGVAITRDAACTISSLLSRADDGLYAAKRTGRNQVIMPAIDVRAA